MRHCIFFLLTLMVFPLVSHAQISKSKKAMEYYNQAKALYGGMQIKGALLAVDKALEKDPAFLAAMLLKADICHTDRNYQLETEMYYKAFAIDSVCFINGWYSLGKAEFYLSRFPDAIKAFRTYGRLAQNQRNILNYDDWIFRAQYAQKAVESGFKLEPNNLGASVNSVYDEYWPSLTADEKTLVFTVQVPRDTALFRKGSLPKVEQFYQEDFYQCNGDTFDIWKPRVAIQSLNSDGNEGAQTLSADGQWLFFTACNRRDGKGSCDIYFARKVADGWTLPVNLGLPLNTPFTETQPTFSADGRTLYFVSNRSGGLGGNDIWMARIEHFKEDGTPIFGTAKNLGNQVNTKQSECSPFIHPDGKTLYFSSEGWPGMGEMDIFVSRLDSINGWKTPVNLGYPINTPGDEIGLIVNTRGNRAYYSSDGGSGSQGGRDLYAFDLPVEMRPAAVSYVKGHVFDSETLAHLGARFELIRLSDGTAMVESYSDDRSGEFLLCLPPGENYALNVSREGYLFYSGNFDLETVHAAGDPKIVNIGLKPIKVGQAIVLNNVFFDSDKYDLKPESRAELDRLVLFLQQNPSVSIEIQGHTDNVGSASYNLDLSTKRSSSVVAYLKEKGIETGRISSKGFGLSQPVASNDTEEGRAQNRRTEMKILRK